MRKAWWLCFWVGVCALLLGGCSNGSEEVGDRFKVKVEGRWGFIDHTGELVIPAQYEAVDDFSEGLACVV